MLFKTKNKDSPFNIIKQQVDNFINANQVEQNSVPEMVNLVEDKTLASKTDTSASSITNDRLTAFLQILFAKPNYDRYSEVLSLTPAIILDNLQEIFQAASTRSLQAQMVHDAIKVIADEVAQEKYYLSRAANFPFLSSTLITYALQVHYHRGEIDTDLESLKKSFSILALLAPPRDEFDEYKSSINLSKNVDVDRMFDQPDEKRTLMKKDIFIKGRQNSIEDIITFIANILVYSRFWVKTTANNLSDYPYVIQMFIKIADFLSPSKYTKFNDKYRHEAPHMYHTLVCYIFNIFSTFVKMAKNPVTVCKLKIENKIDFKEIRIGQMMLNTLIDQLKTCNATSSLQNLFAYPSYSYKIFSQRFNQKKKRESYRTKISRMISKIRRENVLVPLLTKQEKGSLFPKVWRKNTAQSFLA